MDDLIAYSDPDNLRMERTMRIIWKNQIVMLSPCLNNIIDT